MKSQETKQRFIELRAQNKSYSYIAKELQISKSTCSEWEKSFKEAVNALRQEQLNELYEEYYMTKEARIEKLGRTLKGIDDALEQAELTEMPPEKLLDFKLKYTMALKEEYTGVEPAYQFKEVIVPTDIVTALGDLLNRIRKGEITSEQASKESQVLSNLLKAFDAVELQTKLNALEGIIGR